MGTMESNNDTSSTSTQEPGDDRRGKGDSAESLNQPLADEHVNTPQQADQAWTNPQPTGPRRDEPMRADSKPPETLDMPSELEDKLDDVMANPHSDAQETTDTQGEPGPLGGMPKTGSGDQDPMRNAQGSGSE